MYGELIRDHFAILKVGPQLTFALREALFALAAIEEQLVAPAQRSDLLNVAEQVMLDQPAHWRRHYPAGKDGQIYRRYSYSDRIRYYWTHPKLQRAVEALLNNLNELSIPLPLLHQYLPGACDAVVDGVIESAPDQIVIHHIMAVTSAYSEACRNHDSTN